MAESLRMISDEEVAITGWVDKILEEVVDIRQATHQCLWRWYRVPCLGSEILTTDAPDVAVAQAQEPQVALYLLPGARNDLEHGITDRHAEVLEECRILADGHEEKVCHEVADVVLYLPPLPVWIAP